MKRTLTWMPAAVVTFVLGVLIVPNFNSGLSDCVVHIQPITVPVTHQCKFSGGFPGRSISIANLSKGMTGYFPRGSYAHGRYGRETFMNEWYGRHLEAMREAPLLKEFPADTEVYRFLWLRTFHNPMAVRIERNGSAMKLFFKELDGSGGYEPGKLIETKALKIDESEWCGFMAILERANYWNQTLEKDDSGNDGAQWILEGVRENRYHAVDRWSPRDGDFRDACIYLLELAGVETATLGDELY